MIWYDLLEESQCQKRKFDSIMLHQITSIRRKYRLKKYRLWPDISDVAKSINNFIVIFFRQKIHEKNKKIMISSAKISNKIKKLIKDLKDKTGKDVVVLIDEYDLPILEVREDSDKSREHCDYFRDFYGTLKANQDNIHFIFITGISMFSKVNWECPFSR